jgi:hypothetical protein
MEEIYILLKITDKLEQSYSIRIFSDFSGRVIENETEEEIDFDNLNQAKEILMNIIITLKTN